MSILLCAGKGRKNKFLNLKQRKEKKEIVFFEHHHTQELHNMSVKQHEDTGMHRSLHTFTCS